MTHAPQWPVFWMDVVDSTNSEAVRRIEAGERAGFWIGADEQTAGRGRRGRNWVSPRGNLMVSAVIPAGFPPAFLTALSFVAGLAMFDAVKDVAPVGSFSLKWPNDLLCEGGKLGGALVEATQDPRYSAIVGIGINLLSAPELPGRKTCALVDVCASVPSAFVFTERLASRFSDYLSLARQRGFEALRRPWMDAAAGIGEVVQVQTGNDVITGRFVDVTEGGALVIESKGERRAFDAGEVSLRSDTFGVAD